MGDGMVHGVRLRGGRAEWYRNRWVRTPQLAALSRAPGIVFELSRLPALSPSGRCAALSNDNC
jgi:carotenoid cleavage dioxygenase-like enzyme